MGLRRTFLRNLTARPALRNVARALTPWRDRSDVYEFSGRRWFWPQDPHFLAARERVNDDIPGIPLPRCYGLQSAIRSVADVNGDVAECGVRFARSTVSLKLADPREREYFLFDSWEGLAEPTAEDRTNQVKEWHAGDIKSDEAQARANLSQWSGIHFMRGWIPERFPEVADRKFAFVHVDVDLYEATRDTLNFFADRLSPGAVMLCDDYGSLKCPGARKACDEFVAQRGAKLFESMTGQALIFDVPPA